jgi:hypothetical protein
MLAKSRALRPAGVAVFWMSLLCWALGCTGGAQPSGDQPISSQREDLTGPVTITLSAPNPLAPIDPVLLASNEVRLGSAANVVSGTTVGMGSGGVEALNAGSSAVLNETWSRAFATIGSSVQIRGTLHASQSLLGPLATATAFDKTPRFDPPSTLSWTVQYPAGTASNVTLAAGTTKTLAPGLYGTVTVNDRANLTLSAGTYYLTGLKLVTAQSAVTLNQANGPIIVYVASTLALTGKLTPSSGPRTDLLIAYLGTNAISLGDGGAPFTGAIVAPSTILTFQAVNGIHTGFFAAQDLTLAAGAQVQYQRPLAVITAAQPAGQICNQLIGDSGVPPQNIGRFCPIGPCADDTDTDGVPDCVDGCPYDHLKSAPGICGCNIPDKDTDGDGVPDCKDRCPKDKNNITPGQCGCAGDPDVAPAGTPCTDTACPQSNATCNGAGQCGNRSTCIPCPGGRLVTLDGVAYWFCGNTFPPQTDADGGVTNPGSGSPGSQPTAQQACSAKGLTLTRIDTPDENRFIAQFLTAPMWLGANDLTTSGQWRWSKPNSNDGDLFWVGDATGTRQNNLFVNWGKQAPGSARCASMRPGDGLWFDTDCTEKLGYVCSFDAPPKSAPLDAGKFGGGGPGQPVPMPSGCVDEFKIDGGGLPDSLAELERELDAAANDVFIGAAANPPPSTSRCPSEVPSAIPDMAIGLTRDSGAGCEVISAKQIISPTGAPDGGPGPVDCLKDDDCSQAFGAGYLCRHLKDNPFCTPPDAGKPLDAGLACVGHAVCVQLNCPTEPGRCNEIRICQPNTDFDAAPDPTTNLDAGTFDPKRMFGGVLPDASSAGQYDDPPDGSGANHTWCHMVPQRPVPGADQPPLDTNGSSGQGSTIKFAFDPNLIFDVNANPLALGESDLGVHAAATLKTSVELNNFLGQNFTADIVDIGAGIRAERCSINNLETQFVVLGVDVIPLLGIGVPKFNSADSYPTQTASCENAVRDFTLWANRAKKAFRDAQQLLHQYKGAKDAGAELANTLCEAIMDGMNANDVAFFPGGLTCPVGEPIEVTINRFLQYLQAPGIGQISQLRSAASNLVNRSQELLTNAINPLKDGIKFKDVARNESQTILNVPFAIGPVPMVLQVDVFAAYGITGRYRLDLDFPLAKMAGLDDQNTTEAGDGTAVPIQLARMEAAVIPYASAGLSAFVGAGVDLGAFSATIGIDGAVTLARVQAPIYAGAGLDLLETFDRRIVPPDIAGVSLPGVILGTTFQFAKPKSFNFMVWFDYGAGIDLTDVLSGEISARLRIKFLFFSRTWRKRIVKFNGWNKHFDLISGGFGASTSSTPRHDLATTNLPKPNGDTTVVTTGLQGPSMGLAEMQLPLTVLQPLDAPIPPETDAAAPDAAPDVRVIPLDKSAVQSFFYDNLCCAHQDEGCSPAGTPQCCPDYKCVVPSSGPATCQPVCIQPGIACRQGAAVGCCPGGFCGPSNTCQTCLEFEQNCDGSHSCCGSMVCASGSCQACPTEGQACNPETGLTCCGSLVCFDGTCRTCAGLTQACGAGLACCDDNAHCESPPEAGGPSCCLPLRETCTDGAQCCGGALCGTNTNVDAGRRCCSDSGQSCTTNDDCCGTSSGCQGGTCHIFE